MPRPQRVTGMGVLALVLAGILTLVALLVPTVARADDYPTWEDVERARADEAAKIAEIDHIRSLLAGLEAEVQRTQQELQEKARRWQEIDAIYQAKATETANLEKQAEESEARAAESEQRAAEWAAQVVRIGGTDPTLNLFTESDRAEDILSAIGVSTRVSQQANAVYERARQERNTAQSLAAQAEVARAELKTLEEQAAIAMQEAEAASAAASAALAEQQQNINRLNAQLEVLIQNREATEADYKKGEEARYQEWLRNQGVNWGEVSDSGWVRPAGGWVSSGFGYSDPTYGGFHKGLDLAQSCWNPIIAAHEGVVTYAGWNSGGYGYLVIIDHGGGLETWYAHQPEGGILVSVGQYVSTGTQIGHVGTTGSSTGCHLHFAVWTPAGWQDPQVFMASQGIYI